MRVDRLMALQMKWIRWAYWKPFLKKTLDPQREQKQLLLKILRTNAHTDFGREHHFETIASPQEYQQRVPVQSYEDLRPYITKQIETGRPTLTKAHPFLYAQTSGTTSQPKLIPLTPQALQDYQYDQKIFSYALFSAYPKIYSGQIFAIVSPGIEGYLKNGVPFGSMSGLVYQAAPSFVKKKYILPSDTFSIHDYDEKYRSMAQYALKESSVTFLASANPSTFIKLMSILREIRGASTRFADLWPNLQVLATWTGGSAGLLLPELKKMLPEKTGIVEMGYMSSEFRGTITVDAQKNIGVPTFHHTFFEFVQVDDWDHNRPLFRILTELAQGQHYYIFMTTVSGLYRYNMNDIVEVTGFFNKTPTLRFVQKGKGVTNITGEKLYENQVATALTRLHIYPIFHMMIADELQSGYTLYIEPAQKTGFDCEKTLEQTLEDENMEYAAKVKSGRLHPVQIIYLKSGTGEAYKRHKLTGGQREGQYKTVNLQYQRDCDFDFTPFTRTS